MKGHSEGVWKDKGERARGGRRQGQGVTKKSGEDDCLTNEPIGAIICQVSSLYDMHITLEPPVLQRASGPRTSHPEIKARKASGLILQGSHIDYDR